MSRLRDPLKLAQLLLHTPGGAVQELGWLSQMGDIVRASFSGAYISNAQRPTLSQLYVGGTDAQSRAILSARDDERLVRIAKLPSFFGNLLPEGHNRERLAERRGVSADDEFELLAAAGHDLIGALEVVPGFDPPQEVLALHYTRGLEPLEASAVASPMDDGFSIGGYVTKFSMLQDGHRYVIRSGTQGGDIIAKLPSTKYPDLVHNEALCYRLAHAVGIHTANATARPVSELDLPAQVVDTFSHYLHVPRFDRVRGADGTVQRVHFEELAQALGVDSRSKYKDLPLAMVSLLSVLKTSPASGIADLEEVFRRWTAFALMGNTDAHTKNWALLYTNGRHPSLAPAYDMVCVSAYFDADNPLALAQNRQMDASLRHWGEDEAQALAQKAGILRFNQMRRVVRETRLKARALWPALLQEHPGKAATEIARRLQTMP